MLTTNKLFTLFQSFIYETSILVQVLDKINGPPQVDLRFKSFGTQNTVIISIDCDTEISTNCHLSNSDSSNSIVELDSTK